MKIKLILFLAIFAFMGCKTTDASEDPLWEQKTYSQIEFQKDLAVLLLNKVPKRNNNDST